LGKKLGKKYEKIKGSKKTGKDREEECKNLSIAEVYTVHFWK